MINYSYNQFEKDCKLLIRRINYSKFKPKTIVSIATGGLTFGTKLHNKLKTPLLILSLSSYNKRERGTLIFNASFTRPIENPVLIVDDICDTGHTMSAVYNYITALGIEAKTATLFYKEKSVFKPTWYLHKAPDNEWIKFLIWE